MKIKCIAIDDNHSSISAISEMLSGVKDFELVDSFANPTDAIAYLKSDKRVDLIFLDYEMPQMTGIEFLKTVNPNQPVIFISKHRDKAFDSYEVKSEFGIEIVDFLPFPPLRERFSKACERARSLVLERSKILTLRENRMEFRFVLDEIVAVFTDKDDPKYLRLILLDGADKRSTKVHETPFRITLGQILTQLPSEKFLQINRASIINIGQIQKYGGDEIYLIDNQSFTLGGSFRAEFEKVLRRR